MPYSSHIQLVNDANGSTYGFLSDNGAVWQCQWNGAAQRWEQGQMLPDAYGGDGLQALYIDNLWPNGQLSGNGGGQSSNPGIVVAYRIGEGSGAEIYASFGAWASDGELVWSSPMALTSDEAEDQQFQLVSGENGQFHLVVQKQQGGQTGRQQLEQAAALQAGTQSEYEQKMADLAIGSKPDQDLYQTTFSVGRSSDSGVTSFSLNSQEGSVTATGPAMVWAEPVNTPRAAVAQPLGLGTEPLSRAVLYPTAGEPTLPIQPLQGRAMAESEQNTSVGSEGEALGSLAETAPKPTTPSSQTHSSKSWNHSSMYTVSSGRGGKVTVGGSMFPARYTTLTPLGKDRSQNADIAVDHVSIKSSDDLAQDLQNNANFNFLYDSDKIDIAAAVEDFNSVRKRANSLENVGSGPALELAAIAKGAKDTLDIPVSFTESIKRFFYISDQTNYFLLLTGLFGGTNAGNGTSAVNFSKIDIIKPAEGYKEENFVSGGARVDFQDSQVNQAAAQQLGTRTLRSWDIGFTLKSLYQFSKGVFRSDNVLESAYQRQSAGLGYILRRSKIGDGSIHQISISANAGLIYEQNYIPTSAKSLPRWLSDVAYGLVAESYAALFAGTLIGTRKSPLKYSSESPATTVFLDKGTQKQNIPKTFAAIVNGFVVPATTDILLSTTYGQSSGGLGGNFGFSSGAEYLTEYGVGPKGVAASQTSYFFSGSDKGKLQEIAYASAGVGAPFGIYVPILTYHYQHSWFGDSASATTQTKDVGVSNDNSNNASSSSGAYVVAPSSGASYPMSYNPTRGSNSTATNGSTATIMLGGDPSTLYTFQLQAGATTNIANLTSSAGQIVINSAGSGLVSTNGAVDVDVLGAYVDPSGKSNRARASVQVGSDGTLSSVVIVQSGQYSYLAETGNNTGDYILQLDFAGSGLANADSRLPLVTISGTTDPIAVSEGGLLLTEVLRIPAQFIAATSSNLSASATQSYPVYDVQSNAASAPNRNNLSSYSYQNVPLIVCSVESNGSGGPALTLLNDTATARVYFNNGEIVGIEPQQNLYFSSNQKSANGYKLVLDFQAYGAAVNNTTLAALPSASLLISEAESVAYNNAVSEQNFVAQVGTVNAGVYLADGPTDSLPLFPEYGNQAVYNRVVYYTYEPPASAESTGVTTRWYLNATNGDVYAPDYINEALDGKKSLSTLPTFTAASTPTAVTIAKPATSESSPNTFGGDTLVAWVEATQPVIPYTSKDGAENFRGFMDAYYGAQQINYRINQSSGNESSGWAPMSEQKLLQLYKPDGAVITKLQAFNAPNPFVNQAQNQASEEITLLVWTEIPLPGRSDKTAEIKIAAINPTASDYSWDALTSNKQGQSTITSIPWTGESGAAFTINDFSLASMTITGAQGPLAVPVLSFSRDVRTPYRQSVLNDRPTVYLQFDGLEPGLNSINIGTTAGDTTQTFASDTGLDFTAAPALQKSQGTAVQNTNGTGVLVSGLGSNNAAIQDLFNQMQPSELGSTSRSGSITTFTGRISGKQLTVSALQSGQLNVGDTLTGPGLKPGTTIQSVETPFDPSTGSGTYTLNQEQSLASSTIKAFPDPTTIPYIAFSGSITGTVLTATELTGALRVGDRVAGEGIVPGTIITAVNSFDRNSGSGSYSVNSSQTTASTVAAVAAPGGSTSPYTIEFWAKLPTGSNPNGAGLLAFGQPSEAAVGEAEMPEGWLLSSSFVVDRISYEQAAGQGLIDSIPSSVSNSSELYAWRWAVVADGANTTAMNGTGGSNLYSNGLRLTNLRAGSTMNGVTAFLEANGLAPEDLIGQGLTPANVIASVPTTQLQFAHFIDPVTNQPNSNLNTVSIDTSSSVLNEGLLLSSSATGTASDTEQKIQTLFEQLWQFQLKTGEAKVTFSLAPVAYRLLEKIKQKWPDLSIDDIKLKLQKSEELAQTIADRTSQQVEAVQEWLSKTESDLKKADSSASNPLTIDQFAGFELAYSLSSAPAVSVNGEGQIVFDVGLGSSLISTDNVDMRTGDWHYIVASYLPEFYSYSTPDGTLVQLPSNVGSAKLYIDNQLVASKSSILDAYLPDNPNDQFLMLANNAGATIDQVALYGNSLSTASLPPAIATEWALPNSKDALAMLRETGLVISGATPQQGAILGAVTAHWEASNVNPNNAEHNTFYSVFTPAADGTASGVWSQPTTLNPVLALSPTLPSAQRPGSSESNLVLSIPEQLWSSTSWTVAIGSTSTSNSTFNPSGLVLDGVTVSIDGKDYPLKASDVLIGNQPISALQPFSSGSSSSSTGSSSSNTRPADFNYRFLTQSPSLTLLTSSLQQTIDRPATATLLFGNGTSISTQLTPALQSHHTSDNLFGVVSNSTLNGNTSLFVVKNMSKAVATAAVIDQAPLNLKYIDSGEVYRNTSSVSTANLTAASTPQQSFGYSQVNGSYTESTNSSGWLAIAQPFTSEATSNPSGRIWIQYTGQFTVSNQVRTAVEDPANAPTTWLNALAQASFSYDQPTLPLLTSAKYQSSSGGLLIQADPTVGWEQNFGSTMLAVDINNDGAEDLIIAAPQANGGGRVYIVNGSWISDNLTSDNGTTILNLSNPDDFGDNVIVLTPGVDANQPNDDASVANFGSALAFDQSSGMLLIGAPNYLRNLDPSETQPSLSLKAIGALYTYVIPQDTAVWGSAEPNQLAPITGFGGTTTTTGPDGSPTTSYWGSQFGTAIATSSNGELAVSAPGVPGGLKYSGNESVQESEKGHRDPKASSQSGELVGIQLPDTNNPSINVSNGVSSKFAAVSSDKKPSGQDKSYMNQLRSQTTDQIAGATLYNNQAIQAESVGAVYYLPSASSLTKESRTSTTIKMLEELGTTYYGPNPLNTLGGSGFGSSLAFVDLTNSNTESLAIGADATSGPGLVYLINPSAPNSNLSVASLGNNQQLAYASAYLTISGAQSQDLFGSALVNLRDVNQDNYDDLLIQASNAANGAGSGYVVFGSDQFNAVSDTPVTGSVAPGSIGQYKRANGSSFIQPILVEQGYGKGFTGSGRFGNGDINADGINDIQLGSGPNGNAYLTWGQPYLDSISNLSLNKLASNTGYRLSGLATTTQGSLRSVGDFNGDGYGDFISIKPSETLTTVRLELGANTQAELADYLYNYYSFAVSSATQIIPVGDVNGDGYADIALFTEQNLSGSDQGNDGAGSTTGILYGRSSSDLPIGSGFGYLAPVDNTQYGAPIQPLTSLPAAVIATNADASPALVAIGDDLYAAIKGTGGSAEGSSIWVAQSTDAGLSWSDWVDLGNVSQSFTTQSSPSLASFNQQLYLSFLNTKGQIELSSLNLSSSSLSSWSEPVVLSTTQNPASTSGSSASPAAFSSLFSPQLTNRGDALAVLWVEASTGTLYSSSTSVPDQSTPLASFLPATPWTGVSDGSTQFSPAVAQLGSTLYMAVRGNGSTALYWTTSIDGGSSWAAWNELSTSQFVADGSQAPTLAVFQNTLYMAYVGSGGEIYVASLDPNSQTWQSIATQPDQTATYASLVSELVDGVEQLAIYFVANNDTSTLLKTYTNASMTGWSSDQTVSYNNGKSSQTASGPLAVSTINGSTVIGYQGGTSKSPSNSIYLTTSSSPNSSSSWALQQYANGLSSTPVGLTTSADGLILSYVSNTDKSVLQLDLLANSGGTWLTSQSTQAAIDSGSISTVTPTIVNSTGGLESLLLTGVNESASNAIQTSQFVHALTDPSWSAPVQLLQRLEENGTVSYAPIATNAAPALAWLGQEPVLAVSQEDGIDSTTSSINVYTLLPNSQSWQLTSSLNDGGVTPDQSPGLASTDTGLVLTYTQQNGAILLNRLNLLQANGDPVAGLQLNVDGSLTVSPGVLPDLQWQSMVLTEQNSGVISNQATVPLNINGVTLLATIDQTNQFWLNVVPDSGDPESTTWLNSTVQLSDGNGGWSIGQQANIQAASTLSPVGDLDNDGYADMIITANNVVAQGADGLQLMTGLRLIRGGANGSLIAALNNPESKSQSVQLAAPFPTGNSTPVTTISGFSSSTHNLNLSIGSRDGSQISSLTSGVSPYALFSPVSSVADAAALLGAERLAVQTLINSQGWGEQQLNTNQFFGDLNGDGWADSLNPAGNAYIDTGSGSIALNLWSIRAAGDVNGNGLDDVLLSLVPPESLYNKAPQDIQTVLVDGSLFKVDTNTNSFRLDQLRKPLDPFGRGESYDVTSTSTSQYVPLLQNWLVPILKYQPSLDLDAFPTVQPQQASYKSSAFYNTSSGSSLEVYYANAISDGHGNTYALNLPNNSPTLVINRLSSDNVASSEIVATLNYANIGPAVASLPFTGGVIYDGYIYALIYGSGSDMLTNDGSGHVYLWSASLSELQSSTNATSLSTAKLFQLPMTASGPPALVNEGDRLAIYYASDNDTNMLMAAYAVNPQGGASAWGLFNGANQITAGPGSEISTTSSTSGAISLGQGTSNRISATRFQGKTLIAYSYSGRSGSGTAVLRSASGKPSLYNWDQHNVYKYYTDTVSLTSNATQLALVMSDTESSSTQSMEDANSSILVAIGSDYDAWSSVQTGTVKGAVSGVAMLDSRLTLLSTDATLVSGSQTPVSNVDSTTQSWDLNIGLYPLQLGLGVATQQSLAGYSIDGNVDVNGDGFMDMLVSDPSDPAQSVDNQYVLFGGDYLSIASQVGTTGNDVLIGTPLADVIYTTAGDDTVQSNGGADVIYTGSGQDQVSIAGPGFVRIDAGSGFDALQLQGAVNQSFNFTLSASGQNPPVFFPGTKLRNFELINSIDYGSNNLYFDAAAVNALNPDRVLFLTPDASDTIHLTSEFSLNTTGAFNTTFGGVLWNAYVAAPAEATPDNSNPAVVYVLNPSGASNSSWLKDHVKFLSATLASTSNAATHSVGSIDAVALPSDGVRVAESVAFGSGLQLHAMTTTEASSSARFQVVRSDSKARQVIQYVTTSHNGSYKPGVHYNPVMGVIVFEPGDTHKEISVPLLQSAQMLPGGRLSLEVDELQEVGQQELHLQFAAEAVVGEQTPLLSGLSLIPTAAGDGARLRFRADTTNTTGEGSSLALRINQRSSASSTDSIASQQLSLLDAQPSSLAEPLATSSGVNSPLPLDNDGAVNRQVSANFALSYTAAPDEPRVTVEAPDLTLIPAVISVESPSTLRFQEGSAVTVRRADQGVGQLSVTLRPAGGAVVGVDPVPLLINAAGGSAGSITPELVTNADPTRGWISSEHRSVGSLSSIESVDLAGVSWTPSATLNGLELQLQGLTLQGNQVTAAFTGGVMVVFNEQGTASAIGTAVTGPPPQLEVRRLGRNDASLGFFQVDPLTGMVDGVSPGSADYLDRAYQQAQVSGLVLDSAKLPGYGDVLTYQGMGFQSDKSYGVLLIGAGNKPLYASYSEANPDGAVQMISLGSSGSMGVIGIEDLPTRGLGEPGDSDFNDWLLTFKGMTVGLGGFV